MFKKPEDQEKTGILDSIKEDRYVLIVAVAVLLFISGAIIAFQPALQNETDAIKPVTSFTASVNGQAISLSWTAPMGAAAIGYDLYRSVESGTLGEKLNRNPITRLAYLDMAGSPGTYYYTIRAVSASADDGNTRQLQVVAKADETPTSLSLSVNDGAEYTNESRVSLSLSTLGAKECRYRNGPDSDWSAYEPYRTSKYWSLSVGEDGPRAVEYQCRGNDNSESEILSAGITLDRQAPSFVYMLSASAGSAQAKVTVLNETIAKSITCTPAIDLSEEEPFIIDISSGTGSYMYIRQIMPGDHSFSLSCQDEAGNIKSTMPSAFQVR